MLFAKIQVVGSVNMKEIEKIIQESITKGETIKTDGLQAYKIVEKLEYTHDRQIIAGSEKKAYELLKWVHITKCKCIIKRNYLCGANRIVIFFYHLNLVLLQ